ncbi:ABC1 family domain-containing protein [Trichoderma breve]|uniref:ABC1 family domain-containing protein n=1 Tax=Trichoderma breve TaxID=2034170 RepID=A0A9W9BCR1_9HYPO|nr:ABC1 family domain-containing protein [Trichoderma breve]KAJ4857171.1 ABC1 family domain-containing protein [Trichoderma breve]
MASRLLLKAVASSSSPLIRQARISSRVQPLLFHPTVFSKYIVPSYLISPIRHVRPQSTITEPQKKKLRWYWKLLIALGATAGVTTGGVLVADRYYMGGILTRSLRAYATIAQVGVDYKMHSGKNPKGGRVPIDELHDRNAARVCNMIKTNGGIFLKIGQAIAVQGAALPEAYQREFKNMFDDASQESWSDVQAVIKEEFGASVSDVFGDGVEKEPRASASIAQVQRRNLAQQASWDLWTFKVLCDLIGRTTDIHIQGIGDYIMNNIMKETDFENEAANSMRIAELVKSDPDLNKRVYIPQVYTELTSKRVLTSEWIHGAKLWDRDIITGAHNPSGETSAGMGLKEADIMTTVIDLFSSQMFKWGFVHCDPHPGNMFVRRVPSGKPQIVLIDHGLYVSLSDKLRRQYARFWKSLLTGDQKGLEEVSAAWGMKTADAWADTFMSREKKPEPIDETPEEKSQRAISEASAFFGEEGLYPRELIFLERNLALVQGSNRFYDSPVNRLGMIGRSAMLNLRDDSEVTFAQAMSSRWAMFVLDAVFYFSRWKQYMGWGKGFENELKEAEERMAQEMKDSMSGLWEVDKEAE